MKTTLIVLSILMSGIVHAQEAKVPAGSYCLNAENNSTLIDIRKDGTSNKVEILSTSKEDSTECRTVTFKWLDSGKEVKDAQLCEYPGGC